MLQDWHGEPESVDRQINLLDEYALDPKTTTIFHEPLLIERGHFLEALPEMTIDEVWPYLHMEEYWGPSNPYKKFYRVVREQGYDVCSLGDTLLPGATNPNPLDQLAKDFQKLLHSYRNRSADLIIISHEFDSLKRRISFEREEAFCKRIDNMKYDESVQHAVVVTHPAHIDRCASYLANTQNYQVQIAELDSELKKKMSRLETLIQIKFADENQVLSKDSPPLVPMVELAWGELMRIEFELKEEREIRSKN